MLVSLSSLTELKLKSNQIQVIMELKIGHHRPTSHPIRNVNKGKSNMNPISHKVRFVTDKRIVTNSVKIILLKKGTGLGRFKSRKS